MTEMHGIFNTLVEALWEDVRQRSNETFPNKRPLAAHYTSIPVLESVSISVVCVQSFSTLRPIGPIRMAGNIVPRFWRSWHMIVK
jgi:hypothetical protein